MSKGICRPRKGHRSRRATARRVQAIGHAYRRAAGSLPCDEPAVGTPASTRNSRRCLDGQRGVRLLGKRQGELGARADVELVEDLVKVVLDRARTDEQACADLGVREAVTGESCNLGLLSGEVFFGLDSAFAS